MKLLKKHEGHWAIIQFTDAAPVVGFITEVDRFGVEVFIFKKDREKGQKTIQTIDVSHEQVAKVQPAYAPDSLYEDQAMEPTLRLK